MRVVWQSVAATKVGEISGPMAKCRDFCAGVVFSASLDTPDSEGGAIGRSPLFSAQQFWYKPPIRQWDSSRSRRNGPPASPTYPLPTRNRTNMDHPHKASAAPGLPLQGPHQHGGCQDDKPGPFLPLRLLNQQGTLVVNIDRPEMLVGRHRDVDVRLALPDVSRRHCRFVYAEGTWQVFDLKSLNGIFVNGERVEHATLHHGDVLGIGGFSFEIDLAEQGSLVGERTAGLTPAARPAATPEDIWQSIADALPRPTPEAECEKRRAS
jgi:hypothetical protein